MKKAAFVFILGLLLGSGLQAFVRLGESWSGPAYASDRFRVKLSVTAVSRGTLPSGLYAESDGFGLVDLDRILARSGGTKVIRAHREVSDPAWLQATGFDRWFIIQTDGRGDVRDAIASFRESPYIEEAIPEYFAYPAAVPNDPYYSQNWGHNNTAQFPSWNSSTYQYTGPQVGIPGFDTNAQLAWDDIEGYGSAGVVIAILDTGVDTTHPDLLLVAGYDYGDNDDNPMDDSADPGHGTLCAGVAAGRANNSLGVAGIAGGCSIMPLKVADSTGAMTFTSIANAITHAVNNGADIISMSLGAMGMNSDSTVDAAISYATANNVVVFAATANYYDPAYMGSGVNEIQDQIAYPSNHADVISVGAASPGAERKSYTSVDNVVYWGSCYGTADQDSRFAVDIMAPTLLPSTDIQGTAGWNSGSNNNYYWYFGGTSCATPYAAGAAALLLSKTPTLTPAQIRTLLTSTATDMTIDGGAGWDRYTGYGMINIAAALGDPPNITWDYSSIEMSLASGASGNSYLTIGNTGGIVLNYTLAKPVPTSVVLDEGFEGSTFPPADWTQEYVAYTQPWIRATGGQNGYPASAYEGTYNARLYNASSTAARVTKLVTPVLDLSGADSASLNFWHTQANWLGDQDELKVYYKTSSGASWNEIAHYTADLAAWTQETLDLPNPSATYYIAFEGITDYGYGVCLDKVVVSKAYPSQAPWLTINGGDFYSGSVDPARDQDVVTLGFDATGLVPGNYGTTLSLTSNSNQNPSISIPVTFEVRDEQTPVTLSYFNALISPNNLIRLDWITQSESGVLGYYILRGQDGELDAASQVSPLIQATNTSQEQVYSFTDPETEPDTAYHYWLQSLDIDGGGEFFGPVAITTLPGNAPTPPIQLVTGLHPSYPNPFNPRTTIIYTLAEPGEAQIEIFNQRGQLIWSSSCQHNSPGNYRLEFDACNSRGESLPSGVYFYRLRAGSYREVRRMVLSK